MNNASKAFELALQRLARDGGKNVTNSRHVRATLSRMDPQVLWAMATAISYAPAMIEDLRPTIEKRFNPVSARMVLEAVEAFLYELGTSMKDIKPGETAKQETARDTASAVAATRIEAILEFASQMERKRHNFNATAMAGLGDVKEQARVTSIVNVGLAMMAGSKDQFDWVLVTDMDLSTTNNLLVFADAVKRAQRAEKAGQDPIPHLQGAAYAVTHGDKIGPRVLAATVKSVAGAARDGARDGVKWTAEQFMDKVWPVAQAQARYTEPTRREDRGWWGNLMNPTANWSFRGANIRMKFEWLGETLGGMLSSYAKLIALTMGIFFVTSLLMIPVGAAWPVGGMILAGIGAFMGYIAFVVNVTYAPLAIDLGRFLVGTPLLLLNELLNILGPRGDRTIDWNANLTHIRNVREVDLNGPTVAHLRDIRWRVAMATLGLPTFLLLASMIVGPNVNAFVAAFGLGGVSALVSVGAHFYADDGLNKRLVYGGTIVTFPILFVIALLSVQNAGEYYGYDTAAQFSEFYGAGVLNLGQALYLSLPVFALAMVFSAVSLRYVMGIRSSSFSGVFWGGVALVALAFSVWALDSWIPRRDTPLVHVPAGMEQHVVPQTTAITHTAGPQGQVVTPGTGLHPWEIPHDEDIGNF